MQHEGFYLINSNECNLLLGDHVNRVQLCECLQPWLNILHDILLMDEAQFTQDGITNTRNLHSWAHKNPHEVEECNFQHQFSVNV
jgi:hypothetical protein